MKNPSSHDLYILLQAATEYVPAAFRVSEEEGKKAVALQDKLTALYYAAVEREGR